MYRAIGVIREEIEKFLQTNDIYELQGVIDNAYMSNDCEYGRSGQIVHVFHKFLSADEYGLQRRYDPDREHVLLYDGNWDRGFNMISRIVAIADERPEWFLNWCRSLLTDAGAPEL